jgi:hypothetical protein
MMDANLNFEVPPLTVSWFIEWCGFVFCMMLAVSCVMATNAHAGDMQPAPTLEQRNYYEGEVKITNPCLPQKMGFWGENDTPERGWFEIRENCAENYSLRTAYGAIIENGVSFYTTDSGRISGVFTTEYREIPSVKAKGYSSANAQAYARGVYGTLMSYLAERNLDAGGALKNSGNCVTSTAPELKPLIWGMAFGIHYQYPYIWLQNNSKGTGWCMAEP